MKRKIALGVAVVLVLALIYAGARLYPWLRGPSEADAAIEARWRKLEAFADVKLDAADRGPSEIDGIATAFRSFERPRAAADVPSLDLDTLPEAQVTAIAHLVRWAESGAPYADRSCPDGATSPLGLFKSGQAALFTATRDDPQRVVAVLRLAQRMRQRGAVIDLAIGAELALLSAKWTRARAVAPPKELAELRPRVSEIRDTFARESVCIAHRIEQESPGEAFGTMPGRAPFGIVWMRREQRVYRDFQGRLVEAIDTAGADWREIVRRYEDLERARPKSVLLDAVAIQVNVIRSVGQKIDAFDAIVPASP